MTNNDDVNVPVCVQDHSMLIKVKRETHLRKTQKKHNFPCGIDATIADISFTDNRSKSLEGYQTCNVSHGQRKT